MLLPQVVDTLRELKRSTRARLYWILGADAFRLLPRWKSIDEVRRLATFIVLPRPGDRPVRRSPAPIVVDAPLLQISSSDIRDRVRVLLRLEYLDQDKKGRYFRLK